MQSSQLCIFFKLKFGGSVYERWAFEAIWDGVYALYSSVIAKQEYPNGSYLLAMDILIH